MDVHFVWLLCIILSVFLQPSIAAANDFDILVFAQQWPKSTCVKSRRTQNQCNIPNNDDWTVHGIWPSKSGQNGPEDCIRNFPLQVQNLNTIRPQLEARWLNVLNNNPVPFWNHEWQKHGTCSVVLPALDSQFKYFNKGLEWNNDYRIGNILRDSNITPGRNYPLANILRALHQGLGVDPQVSCFRDGANRKVLHEVRICLSKSFQLISCAGHLTPTNCNSPMNIEYPGR